MDREELEQFISDEASSKGFGVTDTRFRAFLIPKRGSDKMYIASLCCRTIADGHSLLQIFSLMQDSPEDRVSNRVPVIKRDKLTLMENISMIKDYDKIHKYMQEKRQNATNRGKGELNEIQSCSMSEPVSFKVLEDLAHSLEVTIDELFAGATIVALSKLDLPDFKKASQYNVQVPINFWPHDTPLDTFQPKNDFFVWTMAQDRCIDLKEACLTYREQLKPINDEPKLATFGKYY